MSTKMLFLLTAILATTQLTTAASIQLTPASQRPPVVGLNRFHFFDIDLLRSVTRTEAGNLLVSPASVKATLGLVLEGAKGRGADELREVLRLPDDQNKVREQLHHFLQLLQTKSQGVSLEMANRMFLAHYLTPRTEYQAALRDNYYAEVQRVNFSQPEVTAKVINDWVKGVTHGLIPSLVEPANFDTDSTLLLANALYFKGTWTYAFDPHLTTTRCFTTLQGKCREVNMMATTNYFNYAEINELNAQAIEFPYQGGRYSMVVLLPNTDKGVTSLVRDLPFLSLPYVLDQMEQTEVQVTLPRFTIDYSVDLVPMLQELGIKEVFGAHANLSGLIYGDYNPQVNSVFHKARIEVNELGSIAAASTGAMVVPLMGSTIARFRANHPFLFFIRDLESGVVLFEGKVVEPDEAAPVNDAPVSNIDQEISQIFNKPVSSPSRVIPPLMRPADRPSTDYYKPAADRFISNQQRKPVVQQFSAPQYDPIPQQIKRYTVPASQQQYVAPISKTDYSASAPRPQYPQQQYGVPTSSEQQYKTPEPQRQYKTPEQQYKTPEPQRQYSAPPQPLYSAPISQQQYRTPVAQQSQYQPSIAQQYSSGNMHPIYDSDTISDQDSNRNNQLVRQVQHNEYPSFGTPTAQALKADASQHPYQFPLPRDSDGIRFIKHA